MLIGLSLLREKGARCQDHAFTGGQLAMLEKAVKLGLAAGSFCHRSLGCNQLKNGQG